MRLATNVGIKSCENCHQIIAFAVGAFTQFFRQKSPEKITNLSLNSHCLQMTKGIKWDYIKIIVADCNDRFGFFGHDSPFKQALLISTHQSITPHFTHVP